MQFLMFSTSVTKAIHSMHGVLAVSPTEQQRALIVFTLIHINHAACKVAEGATAAAVKMVSAGLLSSLNAALVDLKVLYKNQYFNWHLCLEASASSSRMVSCS